MTSLPRRLRAWAVGAACLLAALSPCSFAATQAPFKILTNTKNIIVWQKFHPWLMITEDLPAGRVCYYYEYKHKSKLNLKEPLPGSWTPMGSAIKWLMYVDNYQGLDRLMAHDVDWHAYYIAWSSTRNQVPCGMIDTKCIFGQYRDTMAGGRYPVDLYHFDVRTGACVPFCVSDSEKSQFAHDGNLIVYRAVDASGASIRGIYFAGDGEFEVAARDGIEPSVCGSLVAWAERSGPGYNIVARDIATGEVRTVAYTTANPPRPQAGRGSVFWQDARSAGTSGIDIYGYDWYTGQEFVVTSAIGDQFRLRVCDELVTWVTGATNYQTLWGALIQLPVRITDLRVSMVTEDSVELAWTSVGSVQNLPVSYELRTRTGGPVTVCNWADCTPVAGLPAPRTPGQAEVFRVQPLDRGHHHFALRARFANGDYSAISDSVCAYVSPEADALAANEGACISFSGVVTGTEPGGAFYCQKAGGVGAVRVVPALGQAALVGQLAIVTGALTEDPDFRGPVIRRAAAVQQAVASETRPIAMPARSLGGRDSRFGGTGEGGAPNTWALVRIWGRVSGLAVGEGCSFYLDDGSGLADNDGRGVLVTSPFSPPAGLAEGSFVTVDGISRLSRTSGRQVAVVSEGGVRLRL